jgi:hypothetical protein
MPVEVSEYEYERDGRKMGNELGIWVASRHRQLADLNLIDLSHLSHNPALQLFPFQVRGLARPKRSTPCSG